jgi:hypothetical protein
MPIRRTRPGTRARSSAGYCSAGTYARQPAAPGIGWLACELAYHLNHGVYPHAAVPAALGGEPGVRVRADQDP